MTPTIKDTALKVFWTVVFTALGVLAVEATELPIAWVPVAAGVLNIIGAELRKYAGHYAPPSAELVQRQMPQTRVG